ncbi:MAG TPA: hypothetical protein VMJ64_07005, partial [Anaerolineales bacterium]|nr:hypothetical protein [Anaerolineales bacterium]
MSEVGVSSKKVACVLLAFLLAGVLAQLTPARVAQAEQAPPVQEIRATINAGDLDLFKLPGLKEGQKLYAAMDNISGDLDPALGLV